VGTELEDDLNQRIKTDEARMVKPPQALRLQDVEGI
jgi:hypothetical protein